MRLEYLDQKDTRDIICKEPSHMTFECSFFDVFQDVYKGGKKHKLYRRSFYVCLLTNLVYGYGNYVYPRR